MSSHNDENSGSDEDSAPMAVSFKVAKSENIEQLQKMKDQVINRFYFKLIQNYCLIFCACLKIA
jgi:hypothetical protein